MERGGWRTWPIVGAAVLWLVRGVDLAHSDLVVQRTLVGVRRSAEAFPGDLVADHAVGHPGAWLDFLALWPDTPLTGWTFGLLLSVATAVAAGAHAVDRGAGPRGVGWAVAILAVPLALPGWVDLIPAAPVSRSAAVALVLLAWTVQARGRADWAAVWGGLAVAVHPAVGGGGVVVLLAASDRPAVSGALAALTALPVLGPTLVSVFSTSGGEAWATAVAARWGHHLEVGPWRSGGLAVAVVGWSLWRSRGAGSPRRRRVALVVAGLVVVAGGLAAGLWAGVVPAALARLHPWHWAVAPAVWALVDLGVSVADRRIHPGVVGMGVALAWTGAGSAWRAPPAPVPEAVRRHLATVPADRPVLADPRGAPWSRLDTGRAVVVSVKDGAEVIADPTFARRWSRRLQTVCALDELPRGQGPGWQRLRQACTPPPGAAAWHAHARAWRAAVVMARPGTVPGHWPVLAEADGWAWSVPVGPVGAGASLSP